MESRDTFVYVLIPWEASAPLRELSGDVAGGLENDEVQSGAKRHFFGDHMDPMAFRMVDICTVHIPSKMNGYIGVSLYSSGDSALPVNDRATEIARACGHTSTILFGDVYISRCYDNEEEPWVRRDLRAGEVRVDSSWVQEASRANRGRNMNAYTSGGAAGKTLHTLTNGGAPAPALTESGGSKLVSWSQTEDDVEVALGHRSTATSPRSLTVCVS